MQVSKQQVYRIAATAINTLPKLKPSDRDEHLKHSVHIIDTLTQGPRADASFGLIDTLRQGTLGTVKPDTSHLRLPALRSAFLSAVAALGDPGNAAGIITGGASLDNYGHHH